MVLLSLLFTFPTPAYNIKKLRYVSKYSGVVAMFSEISTRFCSGSVCCLSSCSPEHAKSARPPGLCRYMQPAFPSQATRGRILTTVLVFVSE
jgi:hypothetical protein